MDAFREPPLRRARRQMTTVPAAVRNGRARAKATPAPPRVDGRALRDLLATAAADVALVEVPVDRPPWTDTPLAVRAGDRVTWLSWGRAYLVKPLAIGVPAGLDLICRTGGGRPHQGSRDTMTVTADGDGPLRVACRFPGWLREDGTLGTDRIPYRVKAGQVSAVLVRWPPGVEPAGVLAELAPRDPSGLCAAEAARLAEPPSPPEGWHHHPWTPHGEIFEANDRGGISADCRDGGGILRRPVDVALTPTLRLRWRWRIDELPSALPEDTALTHDYLSVALEFDDGKDLTWQWSCALPVGMAYRCPMDYWRRVETHLVARSGSADLGRWVDEDRPVLADHRVAIGGPAPARVVRAWLIAVTLHQGGRVRGEFGRIELVDGDQVTRVL
ncbi:MAG TPA: DUF3047 domain-containing protein [Pseudonocardia sp.]|nr:DUF3047 domain-containing protein [Pseudonocardia sp.]